MTPERWRQVEELYHIALQRDASQRMAFLTKACNGDEEMQHEIESLLAHKEPAEQFMEAPGMAVLAQAVAQDRPGSMIGRQLGVYQILSFLGAGGMGEVYQARDTRLGRLVALKILPTGMATDPERKRRFLQEAKAASALNHPHIVHIYDIAETDGIQSIAMEYVPGKTLDQLIGRKGLRLNEALKYGIQIADALAKAHSAGIIHRDLKPSNIMVTENGLVKVLDFGLAKLAEIAMGEFVQTATLRAPEISGTNPGAIVGTTAYMSPEQAEGKKVDARSDIFSFGSVLYEMVTGRRAFQGDSKISTLSAILRDDPKPVSSVVPDVPREFEKIISHCLRKDLERRFQHMADVKTFLDELKEESESRKRSAAASSVGRPKSWLLWSIVGITVLMLLGVGVGLWLLNPTAQPVSKVVPLTSYPGDECCASFAPDGNQVAFEWRRPGQDRTNIYVKLVGASEPVRLTDGECAAWSPDGRFIAFLRGLSDNKTGLFLIPPIGGPERKLAEVKGGYGSCPAWHPNGKWLVVTDNNSQGDALALFALSLETGEKRRLTSASKKLDSDFFPAVSPGGEALVFSRGSYVTADIYLLELSEGLIPKGEPRRITFEKRGSIQPAWTADGRAIVFCSGTPHSPELYKIAFSWLGWRPGKPQQLVFAGEGVRQPTISKQGRLAYSNFTVQANIWRMELNGERPSVKPATKLIASTHLDHTPEYSPDGKRIAFASNRSGSHEIWVGNSDGSGNTQLTSFGGSYYAANPHWSPDGRQIYFGSNAGGQPGNYVINSDGGQPNRLEDAGPDSWSRDGRWIYFTSKDEVWKRPARGGNAIQITRKGGGYAHESTDGKFLYYLKDGDEFTSLWKVPVDGGEEARVLESVCCLNFAVVDRGIYFIPDARGREHSSVQFFSFATGKVVTIAALTGFAAYGSSVSPDGQWLLYSQYELQGSDLWMVENFQ